MKFNKYIYIAFAGLIGLSACKKSFLDEKPTTAVNITDAIKTETDMADAVNGMYNALKSSSFFGRDIPVLGDELADNIFISSTNSGRYLAENNYTYISTTAEPANIWAQGYYVILQANRIIYEGGKLSATANVNQLRGEAYAVRALCYLQLVNFFATPYTVNPNADGVALVTSPTYLTGPLPLKPARVSVSAVYNKIISDLDSAYAIMPAASTSLHAINSNYLAKYGAKAIEARAYLYKGDYASARDAALLVVQNGGYTLASSQSAFASYWASGAANSSKLETILELNNNSSSNNGTNGLDAIYSQSGYGDALATNDLYNSYTATDYRKSLIIVGTRGGNPANIVNKYSNYANSDRDELKIIRYAEVLLTLAEAYARTGDTPNALLYLNQLAQKRDPSLVAYVSTGSQLITDILNERRKELAFEGLRFFDFTRLNLVINRPANANSYASYPTVSLTDIRRILPIPQGEIDANVNMKQNPGY